jgi:hypothetical protein
MREERRWAEEEDNRVGERHQLRLCEEDDPETGWRHEDEDEARTGRRWSGAWIERAVAPWGTAISGETRAWQRGREEKVVHSGREAARSRG